MGVCRKFSVWPKLYIRSNCAVFNIMSYGTAIYHESKVLLHSLISAPNQWINQGAIGKTDRYLTKNQIATFMHTPR